MRQPFFKFYPADWRADPALRMCSVAARGLWMEMVCIMHEAEPRGSLLINGHKVDGKQLASLSGISLNETLKLLGDLASAGVFSREDNGTIYSRRMRREAEKAEKDKANGKLGGNPKLKEGVNPPDKGDDKTYILEARKKESELRSADVRTRLFSEGAQLLADQTGRTPDSCKSLIGRWLKLTDDEAVHVLAAIEDAHRNRVADPTAWITATLQARSKPHAGNRPSGAKPHGITTAIDDLIQRLDGQPETGGLPRQADPRLLSDGRR